MKQATINTQNHSAELPSEAARATLDALAARVAHELNNPLDAVLRYINLALRLADEAAEPKLRDYLAQSRTGVVRMERIISEMLNHFRNAAPEQAETPLDRLVEDAIEAHAESAARAGVRIETEFQTSPIPTVRGHRLFQVLGNLIRNAIDAMPNGGRLSISTTSQGTDFVIRVVDTGVGLSGDPRVLFRPFYTTKPVGRGTGLGLAICKELVEQMGGQIDAHPNPQGGAVFTVRLANSACETNDRATRVIPKRSRNQEAPTPYDA